MQTANRHEVNRPIPTESVESESAGVGVNRYRLTILLVLVLNASGAVAQGFEIPYSMDVVGTWEADSIHMELDHGVVLGMHLSWVESVLPEWRGFSFFRFIFRNDGTGRMLLRNELFGEENVDESFLWQIELDASMGFSKRLRVQGFDSETESMTLSFLDADTIMVLMIYDGGNIVTLMSRAEE